MASQATRDKVCDNCGAHNAVGAEKCSECGKKRFAPHWVREVRRINRSFSVQVTDAHEASDSTEPRLTLYKWWPGGKATFNVNDASQWEAVKGIVDTELAPFLGWKTARAVGKELKKRKESADALTSDVQEITRQDPRLIVEIVKGLKYDRISHDEIPRIGQAIGDLAQIFVRVDEGHRAAIGRIVRQLPEQGRKAVEQLAELMEELTIGQIAAVTGEVTRRVGLLNVFKERVLDERTYEITGDGSIHRLLEQAMWIVDERYWLMHSNRQLRTVVGNELAKEDKAFEKRRPDFVCGTVDRKLIIIEIKRPSHTLTRDDLNQLERYVVLCDEYDDDHSSFEAILVGKKASEDLKRTLKVRGSGFKVRTYTQLVGDTERRYQKYLDALAN